MLKIQILCKYAGSNSTFEKKNEIVVSITLKITFGNPDRMVGGWVVGVNAFVEMRRQAT